jgi:hypothetical protein
VVDHRVRLQHQVTELLVRHGLLLPGVPIRDEHVGGCGWSELPDLVRDEVMSPGWIAWSTAGVPPYACTL